MKVICVLISILGLLPLKATSQDIDLRNAAKDIISSAATCALITLDAQGNPRVRAMETLIPENDFIVWFGTNPKSRKVQQIENNPNVTLYYLDNDQSGYVMMYGKAEIIHDKKAKETHWKEDWKAFYPNKSTDYVLIKVTPEWIEIVSNSRGIYGDSVTWEVPKVLFSSKE